MFRDTPNYDIYPDPVYRFVDVVGELFSWGLAGGSAVHFIKGLRGSPGGATRLAGAANAVRQNAPRVAGKFGAYCVLFCAVESAVSFASGRDDVCSATAAVGTTCGLYGGIRRCGGAPAAARWALLGATGYLGAEYAATAWEISKYEEMIRNQPVLVCRPEPGSGPPRWFRMPPFVTREKGAACLCSSFAPE
ncbi:unnamed protein product [Urochloa humidicola]